MIKGELDAQCYATKMELEILQKELKMKETSLNVMKTPQGVVIDYLNCEAKNIYLNNKKRKENQQKLSDIACEHKNCENDSIQYSNFLSFVDRVDSKINEMRNIDDFIKTQVDSICRILINENFLEYDTNCDLYTFKNNGRIASQLSELHPMVFTEHLELIEKLSVKQLIGFLSCFTDIRVHPDYIISSPNLVDDHTIKHLLIKVNTSFEKYDDYESAYNLNCGLGSNPITYDIISETQLWCDAKDGIECKIIINKLDEKNVSLGDFSKAIIKISTITKELINMCENEGRIEFMSKLSLVDEKILKHICTSQSLYI